MSQEDPRNLEPLDPRQVLSLLNEMGIKKITAFQLKEFMKDLKKIIRYDVQQLSVSKENRPPQNKHEKSEGPERLYLCSTFSSRSKNVDHNAVKKSASNVKSNDPNSVNSNRAKSAIRQSADAKEVKINTNKKQNCPKNRLKEIIPTDNDENKKPTAVRKMKSSKNFIKVPIEENHKRSDPVSLYQHYTYLWEKHKRQLPGENNWDDIRWSIREKLLGEKTANVKRKPPMNLSEEALAKRREGWVDP